MASMNWSLPLISVLMVAGIAQAQGSAEALVREGMARFSGGDVAGSIERFDAAVKADARVEPHLWQRGISYYYARRFADGKRQFESHKAVNPHDVENAAWHYLCTARLQGLDAAGRALIPIDTRFDTRVPMKQVYELLAGRGTPNQVIEAAEAQPEERRRGAMFYAHLYLGLYHETRGDKALAHRHMRLAGGDFAAGHYMGDVARLHLKLIQTEAGDDTHRNQTRLRQALER